MNSTLKRHLISALTTFGSTFLFVFSLGIYEKTFTFNRVSLLSLFISAMITAVRAVAKIVIEQMTGTTGNVLTAQQATQASVMPATDELPTQS